MKTRKGNTELSKLAETQIPISSVIIKPWLKDLIRPRTESEQSNLTADIKANGLSTPITLATVDSEENCLIDGHGRLESCQKLELTSIPFTVETFNSKDEIRAWVYRKQLGRRNLTKQDRAYLIGSLQDSKAKIAKDLEIGTTQIADARKYYKAVNWLVDKEYKSKDELLKSTISSIINLHKQLTEQTTCTESVHFKKAVNWKLDSTLVSRISEFANTNGVKSVSEQVEIILKDYFNHHA